MLLPSHLTWPVGHVLSAGEDKEERKDSYSERWILQSSDASLRELKQATEEEKIVKHAVKPMTTKER